MNDKMESMKTNDVQDLVELPESSKPIGCKWIWYHKFHQVIISYGFEVNLVNDFEHCKFSRRKIIFLVLYVDDILLASNDTSLLHKTKRFFTTSFEMKDLGDTSFIFGRDTSRSFSGYGVSTKELYRKNVCQVWRKGFSYRRFSHS